jgi:hypothetical protein
MTSSSQQDPPSTGVLPAVAKKRRILIVDDDLGITTSFCLALNIRLSELDIYTRVSDLSRPQDNTEYRNLIIIRLDYRRGKKL